MGQRLWREANVVAVVWVVAFAAVTIQVMAKAGNGVALWLSQPIVQNVFHLALAAAGLVVIVHAIGAKMAGREDIGRTATTDLDLSSFMC